MPINVHTLAPYGTNRLHLGIPKVIFTNVRQRKAFFASPLWYSLEKYLLRAAFPFNKLPKLPAHHEGSSPTTLSKSTENFLLTLADSWSGPQKPTFFKFLVLGRNRTMPPAGNLSQHNKSQGQWATFVLLRQECYSQSTNISPLPVCVELDLEIEFILLWKALLFLSETWVMEAFILYHWKLLKVILRSITESCAACEPPFYLHLEQQTNHPW